MVGIEGLYNQRKGRQSGFLMLITSLQQRTFRMANTAAGEKLLGHPLVVGYPVCYQTVGVRNGSLMYYILSVVVFNRNQIVVRIDYLKWQPAPKYLCNNNLCRSLKVFIALKWREVKV